MQAKKRKRRTPLKSKKLRRNPLKLNKKAVMRRNLPRKRKRRIKRRRREEQVKTQQHNDFNLFN